jgi:aldose sugar dehydrogenase
MTGHWSTGRQRGVAPLNMFAGDRARHIGRVGALAVALGVGMAVANSPGLAWATTESDGQSSTASTAGSTGATDSGTANTTLGTTTTAANSSTVSQPSSTVSSSGRTGTETTSTSGATTVTKSGSETTTTNTTGPAVIIRNSGGALDSTTNSGGLSTTTSPIGTQSNSNTQPSSTTTTSTSGNSSSPATVPVVDTPSPPRVQSTSPKDPPVAIGNQRSTPPAVAPLAKVEPSAPLGPPAPNVTTLTTLTADATPSLNVTARSTVSSTSAEDADSSPSPTQFAALAAAPAAAAPAAAGPFDFIASIVGGVVSAFLNPFGTGNAGNPQDPPPPPDTTIFGIFDALRRQFEAFFNSGPHLTYNPAQNTQVDNVITGTVTASHFNNATLTFTSTQPAHGDVVITPGANGVATFTYTADEGFSGGQDSFTITATDGTVGPTDPVSGFFSLISFGLLGNSAHTAAQNVVVNVIAQPDGFDRTVLASGLDQPTDFRFLPDGRILIAEKTGAIKVYDNGQLQSQPAITLPVRSDWSRGLAGIEVDPDFETNGYVYASYINTDNIETLSRLTVTDPTADVLAIDPKSEVILLQGDQQAADDHHGGDIHFGPDGKLYWSVGDNGWNHTAMGVISQNSQNLSNIYGKILRLNPDGSAPTDNPFYNTPGAVQQIYAYGFRNPFRFAFTPDGKMLVGDVGESTWEEVDNVVAGGNYGWPLAEGPCNGIGNTSCSTPSSYVNPIYSYLHNGQTSSVGSVLEFDNKVFVADFSQGWIRQLTFNSDYSQLVAVSPFDEEAGTTVRLAEGPDGNLYQLTIFDGDTPENTGTLSRITLSD